MICPKCGNKMIKQNNGKSDYYVCLKCNIVRFFEQEEEDNELNDLLNMFVEKGEIIVE